MTFILNATWKYINLDDDEFIKILNNITEKTSSSSKCNAIEYTKIHDDNKIITDSSDNNFVRRVFNKNKYITFEVKIHLRI